MPNMSYCRFRNTVIDLQDCYNNMDEIEYPEEEGYDTEAGAKKRLIALCCDIALAYGDEIDRYLTEDDND